MHHHTDLMSSPKDSPLSTRELRNRLLRRPLHDDTPLFRQPEPTTSRDTRRGGGGGGSAKAANSPPNSQFRTSSPMEGGAEAIKEEKNQKHVSPGMSMIAPATNVQIRDANSSPKSTRATKNKARSFQLNLSEEEEEEEDDDKGKKDDDDEEEEEETAESDDSQQPSATVVTHRSQQRLSGSAGKIPRRPLGPLLHKSKFLQELKKDDYDEVAVCGVTSFFYGIAFAVLLVCSVAYVLTQCEEGRNIFGQYEDASNTGGQNWSERVEHFQNKFQRLKEDFPGQDRQTWSTVAASIKSVLRRRSPVQPSVLLFVSEPEAAGIARCLAKEVVGIASSSLDNKNSASEAHYGQSFQTKNDLFRSMQLSLNETSTFLLLQLEDLPGSAAMALHALCDNINAPYKRAAIAMTLTVDKVTEGESMEATAEVVLSKAWSNDLDEDRLSPILSRIIVSPVYVKKESAQNINCAMQ